MFIFPFLLFSPILHSSIDILLLLFFWSSIVVDWSWVEILYFILKSSFFFIWFRIVCLLFYSIFMWFICFCLYFLTIFQHLVTVWQSSTQRSLYRPPTTATNDHVMKLRIVFVRLRNHCQFYRIQKQFYTILMLQFFTI